MEQHTEALQAKKDRASKGALHSERNTILGRIRRRRSGEPTAAELARLDWIRAELAALALDTAELARQEWVRLEQGANGGRTDTGSDQVGTADRPEARGDHAGELPGDQADRQQPIGSSEAAGPRRPGSVPARSRGLRPVQDVTQ